MMIAAVLIFGLSVWRLQPPRDRDVVGWVVLLLLPPTIYIALVSDVERCSHCLSDQGRFVNKFVHRTRRCRYCGRHYHTTNE